jgi:hypothetical protein
VDTNENTVVMTKIKERKQLTYKHLYRVFSIGVYVLSFFIFLLGTSIVNSDSPTLSNVTIAVLAFTMIWGVIAAICLSVKKAKESNKQI